MENGLLLAAALLPLGLVGVAGYLWLKKRMKKSPELKLVVSEPDLKRMESFNSRMGQLNAESQRDEDADPQSTKIVASFGKKKKAKKKKARRGKRK